MADDTFLTDDFLRQLMGVGEVDLLVGISPHGNTCATSSAMDAVERGFHLYFPRERAVVINIRGTDKVGGDNAAAGWRNVAEKNPRLAAPVTLRTTRHVTAELSVRQSPGMALRTILAAADLLRARACAVVSPEPSSLTPEWAASLLRPVYKEKFDFVAPLYTRQKFQGLLARTFLYPMSSAVFGYGIRELYSEEWGFSGHLATHCLNQDVWLEEPVRTRPEAWMAISAISSDFRCCQAFLGQKTQSTTSSGTDIVEVFRQTVGNLFWCMELMQPTWWDRNGSEPVQTFGPDTEVTSELTDLNPHRIFEMFRSGVMELEPVLSSILDPETHAEIKSMVTLDEDKFRFRSDLWARTLYDFAASYHHAVMNRDHLVQALVPLYRGMTFSFLMEHSDSSSAEMEVASERLCCEFERQKPYLREKWKAKVEVKS